MVHQPGEIDVKGDAVDAGKMLVRAVEIEELDIPGGEAIHGIKSEAANLRSEAVAGQFVADELGYF